MSDIVFSKKIRVCSKGRFVHKKGIIMGPERFFHKEETGTIKDLLTSYPDIDIEEKTERDNNIVKLNMNNYAISNERKPIGMEEKVTPVPDQEPEKEVEQPVVQVPVGEIPEDEPVEVDETPIGNEDMKVEEDAVPDQEPEKEVEQPEVKEEQPAAQAPQHQEQRQGGGKKKNKNKNVEVPLREA